MVARVVFQRIVFPSYERGVRLFVVGATTASFLLVGCSSEEAVKKPVMQPLAVVDQASSIVKAAGGYVVHWAGLLRNPNQWHFGENTVASVVARDSAGKEVMRFDQPLDAVPPAGKMAFSGEARAERQPTDVKIEFKPSNWREAARITSAFKPFPISNVFTQKLGTQGYQVIGQVGNPYSLAVSGLAVTSLLRDSAGKLLGGGTTYVDRVGPGGRRTFVITVDSPAAGAVRKTDVTARTWGSTRSAYEELVLAGLLPAHLTKPKTKPFVNDRARESAAAPAPASAPTTPR
ncbi:hypothetical protein [Rhizohabitans arisaemae]|uniref:hypothetical protein n=1 Tax=Rhizohabitans arisaemae TaxID=2720610 RepID=UPI0024B08FD0|nr:hypothetical protein [Rhizohabitans arisaemae]